MGDLNGELKPSGQGTFFFKTGCILRGEFCNNLIHGKCLVTLPRNVFIVLKFHYGVLDTWMTKIDLKSQQVDYYKFFRGEFQEQKSGLKYDKTLQETFRDIFPKNHPLDDTYECLEGEYFGSFILKSGQVFNGFIKNGKAVGWGLTLTFWDNYGEGILNLIYRQEIWS